MCRFLLISLSLVMTLVGWSAVCADNGFYVIPTMKGKYAPVPKTGQTATYANGDDGALEKGVAWPTPRFTNNGNGTVTDNLTGLIWLKDANRFSQIRTWANALSDCNGLASGAGGLTDGSKAGDWRLPNLRELQSLLDYGHSGPALPPGHPFANVQSSYYWSSTTHADSHDYALYVVFSAGYVSSSAKNTGAYVWPVRGGK